MRKRLTDKVAADVAGDKGSGIMNDPYQVNNPAHEKNDPDYDEYQKGDPEAWAEGVNKDDLWKKDERLETNHPKITAKMAAEAVQTARKLEERAVKCIVASQRILPGAEDSVIECQAADLMHLPDNMVDALLGRQEELANSISKSASDASDDADEDDDGEEKEAGGMSAEEKKAWKEKMDAARKKKEAAEAELLKLEKAAAGDSEDDDEDEESEEKSAGNEEDPETKRGRQPQEEGDIEEEHSDEKSAADKEEEEEEEEDKEDKETEKSAGDNLLDDIFSSVTASEKKQGAKTLSGMVKKQASSGSNDDLSSVWSAPPDVSKHFQ
jgi:hypothetical protein